MISDVNRTMTANNSELFVNTVFNTKYINLKLQW